MLKIMVGKFRTTLYHPIEDDNSLILNLVMILYSYKIMYRANANAWMFRVGIVGNAGISSPYLNFNPAIINSVSASIFIFV